VFGDLGGRKDQEMCTWLLKNMAQQVGVSLENTAGILMVY